MNLNDIKASNFAPLHDNLIIKPIKLTEKGEFIRPQNEEDKSELGEVVAIPRGLTEEIKVGDIVLFNKYSSTSIDVGKELIVRFEDLVAVYRAS